MRTYTYKLSDRDWYQSIHGKLLAIRIRCGASVYLLNVDDKSLTWYYRHGTSLRAIPNDNFNLKEPFQMKDIIARFDLLWQDLYVPADNTNGTMWSGVYVCVARGQNDSDSEKIEIREVKVHISN
jgi:hypothetical protein